ncbi:MAG TPA: efflux RND transporter periplasmic adaptor subunit [Rhizomicrobium sp.]|nr:efflux RND transporter periplasmic adaptor subunit [Rhizomicrobium sp.]
MNFQINPQMEKRDIRPERLAEFQPIRRYVIGGVAIVLVLGGFWYVTNMTGGGPRRLAAAAPVRVATAERRNMSVIERTIGTVVANSNVSVTARVTGQLQTANFKEGDLVKSGQLLFQIDPRPYQAALEQAAATEARDQAQMENAQNDARRYTELFSQNAISTQQRDQALATAKALAATVAADHAAADMARLNLEYTRIRSPVNGKTGPILIQPGNMITASSSVGASTLVAITEIQPVKISFALPQSDLPRIQAMAHSKGLTAAINLHDAGGKDLQAPVDFISNAVTNTSGTIELRANFANTDSSLVPGQLVDVVVALSEIPGAIVVPREAVNTGPDGQFVYVVTPEGIAEQREVKVLFDDTVDDAIQGNVKDGDTVIIEGQLRVIPGAKVTVAHARAGADAASGGKGRRGRRAAESL